MKQDRRSRKRKGGERRSVEEEQEETKPKTDHGLGIRHKDFRGLRG